MSFRSSQPWRRDPILPLVPSPAPVGIGLRYLSAADISECRCISRACRSALGPDADEPVRRHLARGSPTIGVVAVLDGDVVGYLLYTTVVAGRDSWLELADLGVEPYSRRRGVGSALLRWLRGRLEDGAGRGEAGEGRRGKGSGVPGLISRGEDRGVRGEAQRTGSPASPLSSRPSSLEPLPPRHRIEATVPGRAVGLQVFLRSRGFLAVPDASGRYVGEGDVVRFRYEAGEDMGCEAGEGR